jgi:hypothetical protein
MCGFLAGAFDCEGNFASGRYSQSLKYEKGVRYNNEVKRCLTMLNIDYKEECFKNQNQVVTVRIRRNNSDFVKLINLIETKIERKSSEAFYGHGSDVINNTKIISVENLGEQDVYNFESTTGTYIANGILVHNCYVEVARNMNFNAKKVIEHEPYKGELLKYKKDKIDTLNKMGGLRLFSFGDYMPEHDDDIKRFLDDAAKIGLKIKAITKVPEFVEKFANHPAMNIINVSIDTVGHGVDHATAKALKAKYKNVVIRTVIMKPEDLKHEIMADVDVYTFNHGRGLKKYGYKKYGKKEVADLAKEIPGKVCCATGKCASCDVRCGEHNKR